MGMLETSNIHETPKQATVLASHNMSTLYEALFYVAHGKTGSTICMMGLQSVSPWVYLIR